MKFIIGVLLCRSQAYPSLNMEFIKGLKMELAFKGIAEQIKVITENIQFGTSETEITALGEKLLLEEDASIIIAFSDTKSTLGLQELCAASNKLLLVVNTGADYPTLAENATTTLIHSLNFAYHSFLSGKKAAEKTPISASNSCAFFDSGFHQHIAMLNAFQKAGGQFGNHCVSQLDVDSIKISGLTDYLNSTTDAKIILASYHGVMAKRFIENIKPFIENTKHLLFGAPLMLIESIVDGTSQTGLVNGYTPWIPTNDSEENMGFAKIASENGVHVSIFSLLGWETGLILSILIQNPDLSKDIAGFLTALGNVTFGTPRGWFNYDKKSHCTYGPSYLVHQQEKEIRVVNTTTETWENYLNDSKIEGLSSQWKNTYLCY